MSELKIKLVNLNQNSFGDFEYDFFPDRKFTDIEYVILFRKESWGHIQYFDKFFDCDKRNVQLICITSRNFFPICSNICHKCILYENEEENFCHVINGMGKTKYSFKNNDFYKKYSLQYNQVLDITDKSQRRSIICEKPLWFAWDLFDFLKDRPLYLEKQAFNLFKNSSFQIPKGSVLNFSRKYQNWSDRVKQDGLNILDLQNNISNEILSKSGKNYFCTFQILLSIFFGIGYLGFNGACNFLNMCVYANSLFAINQAGDFSYTLSMARAAYNYYLYNISTNYYCHNNIHIQNKEDIDMFNGWRYECFKESVLNNENVQLPEVKIIEKND